MHMLSISIIRLTSVFLAFALSAYLLDVPWKPFSDTMTSEGHKLVYDKVMAFLFAGVGCLLLFSKAYTFLSITTVILTILLSYEALFLARDFRDVEYIATLLVILSTFLLITSKESMDDEG